jgi:hypothetical protein
METTIREILKNNDGMVLGGNDFLYTKELDSHPMSSFLYTYGILLRELGVDTIFLENHYTKELIQTRGFIGQVYYSAYCFDMKVVGIEGKFTPEEYKELTSVVMENECTTVAYTSKKRLDRLNVFVYHFVTNEMRKPNEKCKNRKYLLFCGMSHVNNETDVTDCKGIKVLLSVPGIGAVYHKDNNLESSLTKGKPFSDFGSGYVRDTDYLLELKRDEVVENRLYIDSFIFSKIHDYYFFYKTYHRFMKHIGGIANTNSLWNYKKTIYPPRYKEYIRLFIHWDKKLSLSEDDYDNVLSYLHEMIHNKRDEIPSRKDIVQALNGITEEDLDFIVDQWTIWLKNMNNNKELTKEGLDILSDIIFLEYKKLSEHRKEDRYIKYLKNKYRKQLERPETKIYTLCSIMKSLGIPYCSPSNQRFLLLHRIL